MENTLNFVVVGTDHRFQESCRELTAILEYLARSRSFLPLGGISGKDCRTGTRTDSWVEMNDRSDDDRNQRSRRAQEDVTNRSVRSPLSEAQAVCG